MYSDSSGLHPMQATDNAIGVKSDIITFEIQ